MSFWELFVALASAASIVSLAIAMSSVFNGRSTRRVVQEVNSDTQNLIRSMEEQMTTLLREMQSETRTLFERMDARAERMDQRADERHREVIQAIQALRP